MKKTFKSFLCMVISFMLILTLAACGITTNGSQQPSNVIDHTQNSEDKTNGNSRSAVVDDEQKTDTTTDNGTKTDSEETKPNDENTTAPTGDKSIVIYFSRTNNTERIAGFIIEETGSDFYEILAKIPYTDDDIKYYTDCRADREQNDPTARPEIGSETIDLSSYDVIYLGYPIWHGQAPKIMYTFVESYDLSGKTIVPFCTSASSGIGSSATNLAQSAPSANWLAGRRFSSSTAKSEVTAWISSINIK